jgi:hypothetical protein
MRKSGGHKDAHELLDVARRPYHESLRIRRECDAPLAITSASIVSMRPTRSFAQTAGPRFQCDVQA